MPHQPPDQPPPPGVILITGAMAAGKSTVAQLVAEQLPRSVHLRGDVFRRMIVSGRVNPSADMPAEAARQLSLRHEIAAQAAHMYAGAGFTVVYQDIILGASLTQVVELLAPLSLAVVVLCPGADVLQQRDIGRAKTGYGPGLTAEAMDAALHRDTPRLGLWLDSSFMSAEDTAHAIVTGLSDARVR